MPRPTDLPDWATTGAIVQPSAGKRASGWLPGEQPPAQYFNWWQNLVGLWTGWFDEQNAAVAATLRRLQMQQEVRAMADWRPLWSDVNAANGGRFNAIAVEPAVNAGSGARLGVGSLCAVGENGLVVSGKPDALAERVPNNGFSNEFTDVCLAAGGGGAAFLICGVGGQIQRLSGTSMSQGHFNGNNLDAIAFLLGNQFTGAGTGVAVGGDEIYQSSNGGSSWALRTSALGAANLVGVASDSVVRISSGAGTTYGQPGTILVAITETGKLQTSPDGIGWTALPTQPTLPGGATVIPRSLRYWSGYGFRALYLNTASKVGEIFFNPVDGQVHVTNTSFFVSGIGDRSASLQLLLDQQMTVVQSNLTTHQLNAFLVDNLQAAAANAVSLDSDFAQRLHGLAPLAAYGGALCAGAVFVAGSLQGGGSAIFVSSPYRLIEVGD